MTTDAMIILEPLTDDESRRRGELERALARGVEAVQEMWAALAEMRDRRLYRSTHPTFEAWCADLNISDSRARQLILAHEFTTVTGVTVSNERQARALKAALKDYPVEYHQTIVDTAKSYAAMHQHELSVTDVKAAGNVVMQMTTTGAVDTGDGDSTPITAAITQEQYELMARQAAHIEERKSMTRGRPVMQLIAPVVEIGGGQLVFATGAIDLASLRCGTRYQITLREINEAYFEEDDQPRKEVLSDTNGSGV